MTYELAKQLKEAGFKQTGIHSPLTYIRDGEDEVYEPYLDELIEALGKSFLHLGRYTGDKQWLAAGVDVDVIISEEGDTPEEAVTKLWLALNKH